MTLFFILVAVIVSHEWTIARALNRQTNEIRRFADIVNHNCEVVDSAAKTFKAAGDIIDKGTAQAQLNYDLLVAVRKTQLQALEMLFIPIEKRAAHLQDSPVLRNLKTLPLPNPEEIKDHD